VSTDLRAGHIFHGELALDQIFTMRPVLDWRGTRRQCRIIFCAEWNASGEWFDGSERGDAAKEEIIHECGEHDRSQETSSAITNERRSGSSWNIRVGGAVCAGEGFAAERRCR